MKIFWLHSLLLSSIFFWANSAAATTDRAAVAGVLTTDVEATGSASTNSGSGLSSGVLGYIELSSPTYLRVGAVLAERKFELDSNGLSNELRSFYLEAPISYLHMFNEKIGWFAGGRLGIKLNEEDCTFNGQSCPGSDLNTLIYGVEAGAHFLFGPRFGLEASYLLGLSEIASDVDFRGGLIFNGFYIF